MAEKPGSTSAVGRRHAVGSSLAAYLPCAWFLVSDATVIKDDRLVCFAEMPIVLAQLPLELAGWTTPPNQKDWSPPLPLRRLRHWLVGGIEAGFGAALTIFCIFLGWRLLSFFMFAWCTHGHS